MAATHGKYANLQIFACLDCVHCSQCTNDDVDIMPPMPCRITHRQCICLLRPVCSGICGITQVCIWASLKSSWILMIETCRFVLNLCHFYGEIKIYSQFMYKIYVFIVMWIKRTIGSCQNYKTLSFNVCKIFQNMHRKAWVFDFKF